jgi:hypothetical protein
VPARPTRQRTPGCFDLCLARDIQGVISPAAANGYFLILSPLSPGRHTLHFGGELAGFRQAIQL